MLHPVGFDDFPTGLNLWAESLTAAAVTGPPKTRIPEPSRRLHEPPGDAP
jgi:hypothetical protein